MHKCNNCGSHDTTEVFSGFRNNNGMFEWIENNKVVCSARQSTVLRFFWDGSMDYEFGIANPSTEQIKTFIQYAEEYDKFGFVIRFDPKQSPKNME